MLATLIGSETVILRDGLSVPLLALQTLWNFEDRGLTIRIDDHGGLLVGPRHLLTDDDRAAIRELKPALLSLVTYCETVQ